MMKTRLTLCMVVTILSSLAIAETVVSLDASTQINGTGFTLHYDSNIGTGNNVQFNGTAAVTNGQVASDTTTVYSAPDVYVVASKSAFTGNFGVGNNSTAGWRIRLNNSVANGNAFFSDNLFAVNNISFDTDNDTLSINELFASDMAAISNATARFVVRDAGSFYISESVGEIQTGALSGNLTTNFSIEALSASWFEYNPTVNPSTNGIADIGAAATPAFDAIDFIGFHQEVITAANGTIAAHDGCNFGVRKFTAQGVVPTEVDPWTKLEYFDFEDGADKSFAKSDVPGFINTGALGSFWNNAADTAIQTDAAGHLVVSNRAGQIFRKIPDAGTVNADLSVDEYFTPFASGKYRLEMNLASWAIDPASVGSTLTWGALDAASAGAIAAGIRLRVEDASTARLQIFHSDANFRNVDLGLTNSVGLTLSIEFDYDVGTATYYTNGVQTHAFSNFTNDLPVATLQFNLNNSWSAGSVVKIGEIGFSQFNEAALPVLAVDFDASQIITNVQYEYFDFALNPAGSPQLTLPEYTGQPIYAGLELDPVNGKTTGDDGGSYTNGGAISFGKTTTGAKVQWNGPFANPPVAGADFGRYEEDDVATGVFLFKKADFLNGLDAGTVFMASSNDTLSATVKLDAKTPARLKSGKFRWVVQDAGSFYISAEVTNLTSDTGNVDLTGEALDLSWFDFNPTISATDISAAASPTLQDIDALGFWMSATILTNTGVRNYHNMQCSNFEAQAGVIPIAGPDGLWADWLSDYSLGANTGFLDHADSDMLNNLTEYAFGGDPADSGDLGNVPLQSQTSDGGTNYIEYVYFERDDAVARGLSSVIDVGTDLVFTNWGINTPEFVGSGDAAGRPGFNAVTNRIPTDTEDKQFIRLQINFAP